MNHPSRRAAVSLDGRLITYDNIINSQNIFPGDSVICMVGRVNNFRYAHFDITGYAMDAKRGEEGALIKANLSLYDNSGGAPLHIGGIAVPEVCVLRPLEITSLDGSELPIQHYTPWKNLLKAIRRNNKNIPKLNDVPLGILNLAKFESYE